MNTNYYDEKTLKKARSVIILNFFIIFLLLLILFFVFLPKNTEANLIIQEVNTTYTKLQELKKDGLSSEELFTKLSSTGENKELLNFFKDRNKVNSVIKKQGNKDYISWLNDELNKDHVLKTENEKNSIILGNIIPIFYQINTTNDNINSQITLNSFINYFEDNFLKKYNLITYDPIGITKIDYNGTSGQNESDSSVSQKTNGIGNFSLSLDVKSKYIDFKNFLEGVNKSGKLIINNGKLINTVDSKDGIILSKLDNLLINIDSLDIKKINYIDDEIINFGVKLSFFVRGIGFDEFQLIKNNILNGVKINGVEKEKGFNTIYSEILTKSKMCNGGTLKICNDPDGSQLISNIRANFSEISIIKKKVDEKMKVQNIASLNISKELEDWLKINNSINVIKSSFEKNASLVDNFNKKGTK